MPLAPLAAVNIQLNGSLSLTVINPRSSVNTTFASPRTFRRVELSFSLTPLLRTKARTFSQAHRIKRRPNLPILNQFGPPRWSCPRVFPCYHALGVLARRRIDESQIATADPPVPTRIMADERPRRPIHVTKAAGPSAAPSFGLKQNRRHSTRKAVQFDDRTPTRARQASDHRAQSVSQLRQSGSHWSVASTMRRTARPYASDIARSMVRR